MLRVHSGGGFRSVAGGRGTPDGYRPETVA
ncbi:hypothetical protein B0E53_01189 [Micromonospora sp. MH33]|nr:hypothetical protein B0E53_01189 [Micromonospora sp. MH33]